MSHQAHLWAIGYDNPDRAEEVRTEINELRRDSAVCASWTWPSWIRRSDGTLTLDGEPFAMCAMTRPTACSRILRDLALSVPLLTSGAVEACLDLAHVSVSGEGVIESEFIRDVADIMQPGTSAFFVLDECGDTDAILPAIRGWAEQS